MTKGQRGAAPTSIEQREIYPTLSPGYMPDGFVGLFRFGGFIAGRPPAIKPPSFLLLRPGGPSSISANWTSQFSIWVTRTVGLKTSKNELSEYLRLTASGATVVITDRDRIVAEIVPPRRGSNAFFQRGIHEGWLTPPTTPIAEPPSRHPMVPFEELTQELERDRDDR